MKFDKLEKPYPELDYDKLIQNDLLEDPIKRHLVEQAHLKGLPHSDMLLAEKPWYMREKDKLYKGPKVRSINHPLHVQPWQRIKPHSEAIRDLKPAPLKFDDAPYFEPRFHGDAKNPQY